MITSNLITGLFEANCLAMKVTDRWNAMRRFPSDYGNHWTFYILAGVVVFVLVLLLIWMRFSRKRHDKKSDRLSFKDHADQRNLSERERVLLLDIANKAELKHAESIFTIATAFDRGASLMMCECLDGTHKIEEAEALKTELSFLREKLGFKIQPSDLTSGSVGTNLSTRQLPFGKRLYLTSIKGNDTKSIEAIVEQNNDDELRVRLAESINTKVGKQWSVQCYTGASIWQFETTVITIEGKVLGLNHSSSIKLASRRRFQRVPVNKPAFIARFSFAIVAVNNSKDIQDENVEKNNAYGDGSKTNLTSALRWGPPEFVPAVVTELAGPGLRIESSLHAAMGERVLVVLGLDNRDNHYFLEYERSDEHIPSRMLEDIGIVRHSRKTANGWSLAIELTGLSDSNVDELIRLTNAARIALNVLKEEDEVSESKEEAMLVQGT